MAIVRHGICSYAEEELDGYVVVETYADALNRPAVAQIVKDRFMIERFGIESRTYSLGRTHA